MDLIKSEQLYWKDIIGHEVQEGDIVYALNGKYTIEVVKRLSKKKPSYSIRDEYDPTLVFQDGRTMNACNVLSLTALNYSGEVKKASNEFGRDALGNPLRVGDTVLSMSRQMIVEKCEILKLSPKTCKVKGIRWLDATPQLRKYNEILSLSALGQEQIEIHHG